jgi:hypothetical protein
MIIEKVETKGQYSLIRYSNEVYDQVAEIANECDLTLKQVVDGLLLYALNHAEVVSSEKTIIENKLVIGGDSVYDNYNQ